MKKNKIFIIIILIALAASFSIYRFANISVNKNNTTSNNNNSVGLANPASELCIKAGGKLEILSNDKGQFGMCTFPSGEKCDEWALFRGECNINDVSITARYATSGQDISVIYRLYNDTIILNQTNLNNIENHLELSSAVSASGSRYLSKDGKVEAWEHQGEITISLDGKEIFRGKEIK